MDEQGYRFGVGVLVVASLVIAVILILFFGAAPNFLSEQYRVTIRFDAAPGVAPDTPVRKNGVKIGRVTSVQLLDEAGVDVTLELDAKHRIRAREQPQVSTDSIITGDSVIEFLPPSEQSLLVRFDGTGGSAQDGVLDENEREIAASLVKDGDFLSGGQVAPDPFEALVGMQESFSTTLIAIEDAGNQVSALAVDVQEIIGTGDGELRQIAQRAEQTIENFNRTLDSIDSLFRDPALRNALDTVSTRMPQLVDRAEGVMSQTEETLVAFEGVGRAAERTMQNVSEFTEPLGQRGEELVGKTLQSLDDLDGLLAELRMLSARINNSEGTVARLLDDDQLYYTLVNTLENVERVTRRLQPVVEDARVFTDKVARDPAALIDLRGTITGRPRNVLK